MDPQDEVEDEVEIDLRDLAEMSLEELHQVAYDVGVPGFKFLSRKELVSGLVEMMDPEEDEPHEPQDKVPEEYQDSWPKRIRVGTGGADESFTGFLTMDGHAWGFFDIVLQMVEEGRACGTIYQEFARDLRAMMKGVK